MELLWCDFINTEWRDWRGGDRYEDRLVNGPHMSKFLNRWGLEAPLPLTDEMLAELQEFRAALRRMAESVSQGRALEASSVDLLNRCLSGGLSVRRMTVEDGESPLYRFESVPAGSGWAQAKAEIAGSFAGTLSANEPSRIRICCNPDCLWVFYDDTRSRTKRYCEDSACGNLMKVRRFRAKRKHSEEEAPSESD